MHHEQHCSSKHTSKLGWRRHIELLSKPWPDYRPRRLLEAVGELQQSGLCIGCADEGAAERQAAADSGGHGDDRVPDE
jgi:hypothetical protein